MSNAVRGPDVRTAYRGWTAPITWTHIRIEKDGIRNIEIREDTIVEAVVEPAESPINSETGIAFRWRTYDLHITQRIEIGARDIFTILGDEYRVVAGFEAYQYHTEVTVKRDYQ